MPDSVFHPTVTPITPPIGAVLAGVSLDARPTAATIETLTSALAEHLVVVLPNQDLSAADLRDCVGHFGPLFVHHAAEEVLHADGLPEVLEMRKEPDGARLFGGGDWHADITFQKPGGQFSFLHAKILPPCGGDTGFASTIAAFEALSERLKDVLRGLDAVHSYDGPGRPDHPTQSAIHPVVRKHPITGREGLFVNRMFTTRFDGMTEAESRPLLDFLDRHMSRAEFCCRVSWKPGQVTVWDNRFSLHYPINDFTGHRRLLIRCSTLETDDDT